MIRDENYRLTENGLRWNRICSDEILELVRAMREDGLDYGDISQVLLMCSSDAIFMALTDEPGYASGTRK